MREVSASVLGYDYRTIQESIHRLESAGVDSWHLDVMDLNFVPNLAFDPAFLDSLEFSKPLYIHLMVNYPSLVIEKIINEYPNLLKNLDCVYVHSEIDSFEIEKALEFDINVGLAIKPETNFKDIETIIPLFSNILLMTVPPGFAGQDFVDDIIEVGNQIYDNFDGIHLSVDGGVNLNSIKHIPIYMNVVSGSFLKNSVDLEKDIKLLKTMI